MKTMMKFLAVAFLTPLMLAQAPQIPLTGNIGIGGNFPLVNSPIVEFLNDADHTMVYPEITGAGGFTKVTSSVALTATRNLIAPITKGFQFTFQNATTGGQSIQVVGTSGTGVTIASGATLSVASDGTNYVAVGASGGGGATAKGPAGSIQASNGAADLQVATSNNLLNTFGTPPGMGLVGDSIANGTGANPISAGYAFLLRPQVGGKFSLLGNSGDQCLDSSKWIHGGQNSYIGGPNYLQECGTNDVTVYNSNANLQTVFKRVATGNQLWNAIPVSSKVFSGSSCSRSGFNGTDPNYNYLVGLTAYSGTAGETLTCSLTTGPNGDIALDYVIFNGGSGAFTIGVNPGSGFVLQNDPFASGTTFHAFGDGGATITTQNGTTQGFAGAVLTGFPANSSVQVQFTNTTNAPVEIGYVGSFPASSTANPYVTVVSPNHQNNANDALSGTYAGFESAIVTQLQGLGLNVIYANTRDALGTNFGTYYSDAIHPNDAGHALMDTTIEAAMPTALLTGAPPSLQNGIPPLFPINATYPQSPLDFMDLNPYSLGGAHAWSPGILLNRGQSGAIAGWLGSQTGNTPGVPFAYLAGTAVVGGGSASGLCVYTSNQNQLPIDPANLLCPIGVTGQSVSFMGKLADTTGGFASFSGNTYANGFGGVGAHTFFLNGALNALPPKGTANSGANFPSSTVDYQASIWSSTGGGTPGTVTTSWQAIPAAGTNPTVSLTSTCTYPTGNCTVDLSGSTVPNKLGTATAAGLDVSGVNVCLQNGTNCPSTFSTTETITFGPSISTIAAGECASFTPPVVSPIPGSLSRLVISMASNTTPDGIQPFAKLVGSPLATLKVGLCNFTGSTYTPTTTDTANFGFF